MNYLKPIEVTIESLGGLGDGIAMYEGKPIFIAKACAGDKLRVRIVHENKEVMHGAITEVISGGPHRQDAPCRYFHECGGCTMQQLLPEHYRAFKTRLMHTSLAQGGFPSPESEVTFLPPKTRRRAEFKAQHDGSKLMLSFNALRSHMPVAVDECMVLTPSLQALIAPVNKALTAMPFARHVEAVSLTEADKGMDMVLTLKGYDVKRLPPLEGMCKQLGLARISVRTPDSKPIVAVSLTTVQMQLGNYSIVLTPDAFLQATAEGQALLTNIVLEAAKSSAEVVDLFSGVGTYSFPLSAHAKTHAVEGDTTMARVTVKNIERHSIANLTVEQRDLFKNPLTPKELSRFEVAVINPPRTGAKAQTEQLAASTMSVIVMISCNPATFSRDAKILKNAGFRLESVRGIDQFTWSQHLEIAAVFKR